MKRTIPFLLLALFGAPFALLGQNPTDACGVGVTTLTSNASCTTTNYTLPGTYANGGQVSASCMTGQDRDDGWYQFVATGTSTTVEVTGDRNRTIAAFTGSCGTGELACDAQASGTTASITFPTTVSTTYYIQIHRNNGNNAADMTGTICVHASGGGGGVPTGTVQPTACTTMTVTLTPSQTVNFYDDGGVGGDPCLDVSGTGNYCNCNCFTTTTICGAPGEFIIASFSEWAMWNTTSGWDWMRIYDNNTTSGTVLYDNSSTGPDNPRGDCGINSPAGGPLDFCSTGNCLTFQFWATSVVNRAGWEGLVTSTPVQCTPPLVVDMLTFEGEYEDGKVKLEWVTSREFNNDFFTVMRSSNGITWKPLQDVDGAGNSEEEQFYRAFDEEPLSGISYYQLMQTDFNGTVTYSNVIQVLGEMDADINVYPNPTRSSLFLAFDLEERMAGTYKLVISDILGQVHKQDFEVAAGQSQFEYDPFNDFTVGVYLVKVYGPDNALKYSQKVIKE